MATAKKTARKKSAGKTASKRSSTKKSGKKSSTKKTPAKKSPAKKSASKRSSSSVKKNVKTSSRTAKKTGVKRTNVTQYEQHKTASGKTVRHKMSPKQAKGKKESLIRQKRSTGAGPACWPGFERVPGTKAGTKGSCEPKPHQTAGERKEDARQAAGSKLRKAGGSKAKANHMR